MGVLTNVFRRGGVFYFRARVPGSLRVLVGRRELWRSLRTREPTVARHRGALLFALTEALWHDLQQLMSTDEVQALIDGWLKAKLTEDAEVRRTAPSEAIAAHDEALVGEFGDAFWNKAQNDPALASRHVAELLSGQGLVLEPQDLDIATRLMMRAHYDFFRAFVARRERRWRPWLDDDPAAALVNSVSAAPAVAATVAPSGSVRINYGLLSVVAREAIADFARKDGWRPKSGGRDRLDRDRRRISGIAAGYVSPCLARHAETGVAGP